MSTWQDIEKIINHLKLKGSMVALFQCTSKYPTSLEEIGLNVLTEIKSRFNIPNGLSDHSGTPWPSLLAISNQANFLEVHVNFDRAMYGPDSTSSLNFSELSMICQANKAFAKIRNNPVDKNNISNKLSGVKTLFTKSLAPIKNLPAGTILSKEMLTQKKPGGGISIDDINKVIGKSLKFDIKSNRLLKYEDLEINN